MLPLRLRSVSYPSAQPDCRRSDVRRKQRCRASLRSAPALLTWGLSQMTTAGKVYVYDMPAKFNVDVKAWVLKQLTP